MDQEEKLCALVESQTDRVIDGCREVRSFPMENLTPDTVWPMIKRIREVRLMAQETKKLMETLDEPFAASVCKQTEMLLAQTQAYYQEKAMVVITSSREDSANVSEQ